MKYIDLTLPLFDKMPVFEGDPEVEIKQVHFLDKEGWNLRTMFLTTHLGTHVNVPIHMTKNGRNLNDYSIEDFIGRTKLYSSEEDISNDYGIAFTKQNITSEIAELLVQRKPKFILLSAEFEFDIEIERHLLEAEIISFENLINTDLLPTEFDFYGIPLNIKDADGSPIRAFAVVE